MRSYVGVECADKNPTLSTMEKLAKFFKTTPAELLKDA